MLSRLTTSRRSHLSVVVGFILLTLLTLVLLAVTPADGRSALARFRAFTVREYLLPHKDAYAHDPAVAADGGVYFADQQGHYIGHLDPETGKVTEYPTPAAKSGPHGIIVAPDGGVWYNRECDRQHRKTRPQDREDHRVQDGRARHPDRAWDPHTPLWMNGMLWFTAQNSNKYGTLNPETGEVTIHDVPRPVRNRTACSAHPTVPLDRHVRNEQARTSRPENRQADRDRSSERRHAPTAVGHYLRRPHLVLRLLARLPRHVRSENEDRERVGNA
jgi:hypothetical protein